MAQTSDIAFCKGGGCTAKLGQGILERVLSRLPKGEKDDNLLVGYDASDDAAVYRLTDDMAIVQTLDFFPPMVEDPYTFGQIAATNALSDIFAMGGEVLTALNIVCFPEQWDLNILGEIMRGGAEKVAEAGGILAGGHSIMDTEVKYGLSVTGKVHPGTIWRNQGAKPGDKLILTKALGVGLICTAKRIGEAKEEGFQAAVFSMTQLNKSAAEAASSFTVHACTDVTGFSFLGHLLEMMTDVSCVIEAGHVPVLPDALRCAEEFYLTAAAQRNRNHAGDRVCFQDIPFAMQEVLFDPQTSGGLLMAIPADEADACLNEMLLRRLSARIVGEVTERTKYPVTVV